MQVSQERFNLTPTERRGVDTFKEYLWYDSRVCSHCFTQVRTIEEENIMRGKNSHIEDVWEYHERTDNAESDFTPWDGNPLYGTTFCLECGSDCSADHRNLPIDELKPIMKNIFLYVQDETPLELDLRRFVREVSTLKSNPDYQGKESQILALGFSRALE